SFDVWRDRAIAYEWLHQWSKADADYGEALQRQKDNWHLWLSRGKIRAVLGQWDKAHDDLREALKLSAGREDDEIQVWEQIARTRLASGDLEGYRRTCADMLGKFGESKNLDTAYYLSWACVLGPASVTDYSLPLAKAYQYRASQDESSPFGIV